jgi:hypothetical protein
MDFEGESAEPPMYASPRKPFSCSAGKGWDGGDVKVSRVEGLEVMWWWR